MNSQCKEGLANSIEYQWIRFHYMSVTDDWLVHLRNIETGHKIIVTLSYFNFLADEKRVADPRRYW